MTTISIEVDETVENFLRKKNTPYDTYLGKLIQQDMLLEEIELSRKSGFTLLESVDDLGK